MMHDVFITELWSIQMSNVFFVSSCLEMLKLKYIFAYNAVKHGVLA